MYIQITWFCLLATLLYLKPSVRLKRFVLDRLSFAFLHSKFSPLEISSTLWTIGMYRIQLSECGMWIYLFCLSERSMKNYSGDYWSDLSLISAIFRRYYEGVATTYIFLTSPALLWKVSADVMAKKRRVVLS